MTSEPHGPATRRPGDPATRRPGLCSPDLAIGAPAKDVSAAEAEVAKLHLATSVPASGRFRAIRQTQKTVQFSISSNRPLQEQKASANARIRSHGDYAEVSFRRSLACHSFAANGC